MVNNNARADRPLHHQIRREIADQTSNRDIAISPDGTRAPMGLYNNEGSVQVLDSRRCGDPAKRGTPEFAANATQKAYFCLLYLYQNETREVCMRKMLG